MNHFWKLSLFTGALALTFTLAGCGNNAEPTTTTQAPPMSGNMDNTAATNSVATAKGATPGTTTKAGPFEITLALDAPEPKVGDAQFKATVKRDGKPVTDATIKLELSMPQMKMSGPTATLAHTENGIYLGKINLSMGGAYRAKISVSADGATGDAVYEFRAVQ